MTKVTIQRDICLPLILPLIATHDFVPLPPFPPLPFPPIPGMPFSLAACALEIPVNAWWPPGAVLGSHKFTSTVFHNGMQICLEGHDCGKFIPHLQITPAFNNLLTFLQIPFSSRKANFSASTVLMNGKPTAGMTLIAWPPTPMTYCADPISPPLADAPTSHFNTVEIHISLMDWLAGAFAVALSMVVDYVLFRRGGVTKFQEKAAKEALASEAGDSVARLVSRRVVAKLKGSLDSTWAIKQGVSIASGAMRIALTGQGSMGVTAPFGGGFASLGRTVSKDDKGWNTGVSASLLTGTASVDTRSATATHRDPLARGQQSVSHKFGEDGSTHTQQSTSDPFGGFHNQTTTTGPDGVTKVTSSRGPTTTLPGEL